MPTEEGLIPLADTFHMIIVGEKNRISFAFSDVARRLPPTNNNCQRRRGRFISEPAPYNSHPFIVIGQIFSSAL